MKKEYAIINAYEFEAKETKQKMYCVEGILQTTAYPVKGTKKFYFNETDFNAVFGQYLDPSLFNFGIPGLIVELEESLSVKTQ